MTRTEALAIPTAEALGNGRCVGHIEYDEQRGTVLVIDWHDPAGCEHPHMVVAEDLRAGDVVDLEAYAISGEWEISTLEYTCVANRPAVYFTARDTSSVERIEVEVEAADQLPVLRNTVDDYWARRGYVPALVAGQDF